MRFRYRFVDFGTTFTSVSGQRSDGSASPDSLHENELALDVGGVCWGVDGEQRPVVDHHFYRSDAIPSAAASVLHLAGRIHERFSRNDGDAEGIWLVTHRQPDFDAFTSMCLARGVIDESIPHDGWEELGVHGDRWGGSRTEIDWFHPRLDGVDLQHRWPALLAAAACCVDNCRQLRCPRHRALHSVLYAALLRGRDYLAVDSGAKPFFEEVRRILTEGDQQLNPLFDSVFEGSEMFAPELALLDRQLEAYEIDIRRARRAVVYLARSTSPFGQWYGDLCCTPLLNHKADEPTPREAHVRLPGQRRQQADGIYLRDPKCLLFKEWVRNDIENSPLGEGFLFSAIAYSGACPAGTTNTSTYFFALDPERASQRHLYNAWARLEVEEIAAIERQTRALDEAATSPVVCRRGFEGRAAGESSELFDDPWFDGGSYQCTIVASPGRGTAIGPAGSASDLSDDPVARIVQRELELGFIEGDFSVRDFPTSGDVSAARMHTVTVGDVVRGAIPTAAASDFRFAQVTLADDVEMLRGTLAEQLGRLLWRLVDPERDGGLPSDFVQRHLVRKADWVGVWSRRGIVVAAKASAAARVGEVEGLLREMADLAAGVETLVHRSPTDREGLAEGETLVRRVVQLKRNLALPDGHFVRRFFEASRLDEVLAMLRDINQATVARLQSDADRERLAQQQQIAATVDLNVQRITRIQSALHVIEYIVAVTYCVELWEAFIRGNERYEEGKHALGHWLSEHLGFLNVGNWFSVFSYFHWDLLLPAALGFLAVVLINYAVEGHCAEWHWLKRRLTFGKRSADAKESIHK